MVTDTAVLQMTMYNLKFFKTIYTSRGWNQLVRGLACRLLQNSSKDSAAVTDCGSLFQSLMFLGRRSSCRPHWWFSLGRTCDLHGFYCLHFVGTSPSSHLHVDGQSCTAWRVCCPTVSSVECPIPDLFAYGSHSQMSLSCNRSSRT